MQRDLFFGYLMWACGFIGFAGLHRFYTGRIFTGFLWFATGGFCFLGQLIDLAFIPYFCAEPKMGWGERKLLRQHQQARARYIQQRQQRMRKALPQGATTNDTKDDRGPSTASGGGVRGLWGGQGG